LEDQQVEDLIALLPPLISALEQLQFVARHLHPPDLAAVLAALDQPDAALAAARPRLDAWPERLAEARANLAAASDATLKAFADLRAAGELTDVWRALRGVARAQEALYPLAHALPPLNRYFLNAAGRADAELQQRLAQAPARPDTGVFHVDNEYGTKGGFSLYVPETYAPERPHPLVVALHGGSGHGRGFLWTWLRDARSAGAILVAPTSAGQTWALTGPDIDSPRLAHIVAQVRARWSVDERRLLLTGMSDGGTFAYVSGLEPASPFTHLAPISAAFHPMLAGMADPDRLRRLPIHIAHGALDWMFPIDMAREADAALTRAGAAVTYREIGDLSHTYPSELNAELLAWMESSLP
jgi:phospholipase/carboxylesterase